MSKALKVENVFFLQLLEFLFLTQEKTAVHSQICRIYCSNNDTDKRKFKQWWFTIPPIPAKWTITSLYKSVNTKKKTIALEIQVLTWDRHKRNGVVKPVRLQKSCHLLKFWWLVVDRFMFSLFMIEHFSFYYSAYYNHIMIFLANNISFKLQCQILQHWCLEFKHLNVWKIDKNVFVFALAFSLHSYL